MTPRSFWLLNYAVFLACSLTFLAGMPDTVQGAKPPNDNFANAQRIAGRLGSISGTNVEATRESGEPILFPDNTGNTIWYRWVAPATGRWAFETAGSDFDTFLAVFSGTNLASLPTTLLASNDDVWLGTITSLLTFQATSNTEYRILVDGVGGDSGVVLLNWLPTPSNDDFVNAQVIEGATGVLTGRNIGATMEINEPVHTNSQGGFTGASVWYRWTAPRSGLVAVDTAESNFDTMLAIFTGSTLDTVTLVGANDNNSPDGSSVVWFMASAGVRYAISVNARLPDGVTERFRLHWYYVPDAAPPNDSFAAAQSLAGAEGTASGVNYNASRQSGESQHAGSNTIGASIWYNWTPPTNGQVIFDTACSSFNTRLAVYTGNNVDALTLLTNNESSGSGPLLVPVTTSAVYRLAVDGYLNLWSFPPWLSPTGRVNLNWLMVPARPANDAFSNSRTITGPSGTVSGSNCGASRETDEPFHCGNIDGASVWYRWVAPQTATFTFDTAGSSFDTVLAVYTGSAVDHLTLIAENDDQQGPLRTSSVFFLANSNTTYFITVDGYSPETNIVRMGRFALNWGLRYQEPTLPAPRPILVIQPNPSGTGQIISWPASFSDFRLQAATNLAPPATWIVLSNVTVTAGSWFYTNRLDGVEAKFFRLIKP